MNLISLLTTWCLFSFSLYHVITGIISVFFPNKAIRFYKVIYGFHPIETEQLKMSLRPWGNLALIIGLIGALVLTDIEKYKDILVLFALLLIIRIGYRVILWKKLNAVLNVTKAQNIRMIIIQLVGAFVFLAYYSILM